MFTGIITDLGGVQAILKRGDTRFQINTSYDTNSIALGASISCSGTCLTVVEKGKNWFATDVSGETLSKTTLGCWSEGTPVNLERSLKLSEELGGHFVAGHVDGVGVITSIDQEGDSFRFEFSFPEDLARFIARKGSITVNGVSLTVNEITNNTFVVNIIPHTQNVTTFGTSRIDDRVNLEIDLLSRYVARLLEKD